MSPSPRMQRNDIGNIYFLTLTVIGWVNIFADIKLLFLLRDAFQYCIKNKGLILYEYVFMRNHIHIIAGVSDDCRGLDTIIRDFKSFTTHSVKELLFRENNYKIINQLQNSSGIKKENCFQLWMRENYPVEIVSDKFLEEKTEYIWQNPVTKGYVVNPEDWMYSSARQKNMELPEGHSEVFLYCGYLE